MKPCFLFDEDCTFCRWWVSYWKHLVTGVEFTSLQAQAPVYETQIGERYYQSVHYISPNGTITSAAEAVTNLLLHAPQRGYASWMYQHLPGVKRVSEFAYKQVASCRTCSAKFTRLLWGTQSHPSVFLLDAVSPLRLHPLLLHVYRLTIAILFVWVGITQLSPNSISSTVLGLLQIIAALGFLLPRNPRDIAIASTLLFKFLLSSTILPATLSFLLPLTLLDLSRLFPKHTTSSECSV